MRAQASCRMDIAWVRAPQGIPRVKRVNLRNIPCHSCNSSKLPRGGLAKLLGSCSQHSAPVFLRETIVCTASTTKAVVLCHLNRHRCMEGVQRQQAPSRPVSLKPATTLQPWQSSYVAGCQLLPKLGSWFASGNNRLSKEQSKRTMPPVKAEFAI